MPNLVNRLLDKEYKQALGAARGMVILTVTGQTMEQNETFRDQLAEKGVKVRVVRNTLARRALAERGIEVGDGVFTGTVAVCYGEAEAAIHTAKLLVKPDAKKIGKLVVRGGVLEDTFLDAKNTLMLAGVPDKNTLRAQIVGAIQGPGRALVTLLDANQSGLARVLQAKNDKQGAEAQ
ncbi:MAG: 50S ribosomal protein L10 [Planctomycetes bacterium]|nr:50S ribosomal protein L10 [Planctomycetota bacterium]